MTLRLGERRLEITIAEAKEIQQRAVESRLAAAKLHAALRGAHRIYPGRVEEIIIDEDMRQELLLDLIAIEDTHPLSAIARPSRSRRSPDRDRVTRLAMMRSRLLATGEAPTYLTNR